MSDVGIPPDALAPGRFADGRAGPFPGATITGLAAQRNRCRSE
jgi:hypothetical protein